MRPAATPHRRGSARAESGYGAPPVPGSRSSAAGRGRSGRAIPARCHSPSTTGAAGSAGTYEGSCYWEGAITRTLNAVVRDLVGRRDFAYSIRSLPGQREPPAGDAFNMPRIHVRLSVVPIVILVVVGAMAVRSPHAIDPLLVNRAVAHDVSTPLAPVTATRHSPGAMQRVNVEQRTQGSQSGAALVASFDGLGIGFDGPQGPGRSGNPSDNSLAVGPNHIVQTVNSRMAIFTKKGSMFDTTGKVLYGSVSTNNVFRGFTGTCEARNNGDAVVRYDQLADRWLIVMPIFSRAAPRPDQPTATTPSDPAQVSVIGVAGQPGPATPLFHPPR